jgi:ribosomal-protein-alanine N-acetyltransferase
MSASPVYRIDRGGGGDCDRLARVHATCFDASWSASEMGDLMRDGRAIALILADGTEDQGLCLIRPVLDEAEILTIAIDPAARRKGAGAELLAAAESAARQVGTVRVFLEVSVRNAAARALYARAGYSEIARRKAYYADRSDACVLEKTLSGDGQNRP